LYVRGTLGLFPHDLLIYRQAGAIAAFTVDVLVYPLDTIKTRIQSQDYIKTYSDSSKNNIWAVRGLYQGIGSVVLATLPAGSLYLTDYHGLPYL
jgi:hypothetical protein